jgi:hypothetical protein
VNRWLWVPSLKVPVRVATTEFPWETVIVNDAVVADAHACEKLAKNV